VSPDALEAPLPIRPARSRPLLALARADIGRQILGYGLVSLAALALDLAIYLGLTALALYPAAAAVIGYGAGLAGHFVLSSRVVFDVAATGKSDGRLASEFALSGLGGLVITAATVALLTDFAGLAPIYAKAAAVAVSFVAVFLWRRAIVFAPRGSCPARPAMASDMKRG
jgi:putative flippase GtrA